MIHDNSLTTDEVFCPTLILKLFSVVEMARGFDENFMCDLYDTLRDFAQADQEFEDALVKSEVMCSDEIWGLPETDEEAINQAINCLKRGDY